MQTDARLKGSESNNSLVKQGQEGRLWTPSAHWHFRQEKLIQTKFCADTCHFHPHFHGNRHCIGQDKARTTNPAHVAKDGANANEQEELNASS